MRPSSNKIEQWRERFLFQGRENSDNRVDRSSKVRAHPVHNQDYRVPIKFSGKIPRSAPHRPARCSGARSTSVSYLVQSLPCFSHSGDSTSSVALPFPRLGSTPHRKCPRVHRTAQQFSHRRTDRPACTRRWIASGSPKAIGSCRNRVFAGAPCNPLPTVIRKSTNW